MTAHAIAADRRAPALGFGRAIVAVVKRLQVGQMESVLRRMPEAELRRMGVTRAQIPQHARWLVLGDS